MRPTTVTVGPLAAAAANNIALSQSPTGAFTLNGSLVTAGVAILDTPRQVLFTQASSESGKTYTIVGTSDGTIAQTEVLSAAASATTVGTALNFKTVTSITISSASAGAITVGTSGVAQSRWIRLDDWIGENVAIQCTVTGTVNYTVQGTMQDPNSPTNPVTVYSLTWVSVEDTLLVGATATASGVIPALPIYIRVLLNSGSGSVSTVVSQASEGGGPGFSGATIATITNAVGVKGYDTTAIASPTNPLPVRSMGANYETVAASANAQILGATGAVGDILDGILIVPATTAAGAVSITDGDGSAITIFAGATVTALSSLIPFYVPVGNGSRAVNSTTPGWKVTTGANVSAIGFGRFT